MKPSLVRQRFGRSVKSYAKEALPQKDIAQYLLTLILKHAPQSLKTVLELGCGSGFLTKDLLDNFRIENYYLNDLVPEFIEQTLRQVSTTTTRIHSLQGDARQLEFPSSIDLLVGSSVFQWFEPIDSILEKITYTLSKEGILAFNSFGVEHFVQLRKLGLNSLEATNNPTWKLKLKEKFHIIESTAQQVDYYFESPMHILKHMKLTGVNGLQTTFWTKGMLMDFCNAYETFKVVGKGYPLTFHPEYYIAKSL